MSEKVVFSQLSRKFIDENDATPDEAQQVVYYSLAIGHHLGVIDCLEAALPSLSALMVRVECGERLSIRLMMEEAAGLPNRNKYRSLGQLIIDDADGALCATLSLQQGGERA